MGKSSMLDLLAEIKIEKYFQNPPCTGTAYEKDSQYYDETLEKLRKMDISSEIRAVFNEAITASDNYHETFARMIYRQGLKDGLAFGKEIREIL